MTPSPTYIHYRVQWKVLGPESPGQRFEREQFQKFFEDLNANREFSGYDDFSYRPDRCELAKARGSAPQGGQAFSKVVYADDTLSIVEEWTDESTRDFAQKLKIVLDCWFGCFAQTLAVVQTCVVRAITTPAHFDDSRHFLGHAVLGLDKALGSRMQGPLYKVGFTLGCQRVQGKIPMNFECVASSWRDNRSVWLEVRADAPLAEPLNAARHDQAETLFGRCTEFLERELLELLLYYNSKDHDSDSGATP